MSSCVKNQKAALEVILYFTSGAMGRYFGKIGKQTPANYGAYQYSEVYNDEISKIFKQASKTALPTPNIPEMSDTWGAGGALNDILRGGIPEDIWKKAQIELMLSIEKNKGVKVLYSKYLVLEKPIPVQ